jgi:hypothetical protein
LELIGETIWERMVMKWQSAVIAVIRAIVLGLVILHVSQTVAETHAVVVGINRYPNVTDLLGAVADADDISDALKKAGVQDVATFLDGNATRKNVLDAIDRLATVAKKDDLAIVTFAGHGSRENWGNVHPVGTHPGDPHEVFLLGNVTLPNADGKIDPRLGGSGGERIFGVEIALRLKRLDDLGVRTIFVADTCHGGGLTRMPIPSAPSAHDTERYAPNIYAFADGVDPLLPIIAKLPAPIDTDKELHQLSFLAAVDDLTRAPEVEIPKGSGNRRGALSYAFARVIEGAALRGGRTELTHGDLLSYVMASVKNSALDNNKGQNPDLRPRENFMRVAIKFGIDLKSNTTSVNVGKIINGIKIYVQNAKPVDPVSRLEHGFAIQPVTDRAEADLIYNPVNGDVFSKSGDLISMGALPADIEGLAEREVAIRRLVELAKTRQRPLALNRGDQRYMAGDFLVLDARKPSAQSGAPEYCTLIIISGNGKIQFQYPLDKDSKLLPTDRPLGGMQAGKPFGADYAVFVADEKPLDTLIDGLRRLSDGKNPNAAVDLIERSLSPTMQIGLQGMYTAPKTE